jgi:hypothetical protein
LITSHGVASADSAALLQSPRLKPKYARSEAAERSARVSRSLLLFTPAETAEEKANGLDEFRARDRLQLMGLKPHDESLALGALVVGMTSAIVARAPKSVRAAVDGPVHLGPALLQGGALGAGIVARGM